MKSSFFILALGLAWTAAGIPTPDNTCGNAGAGANQGYSCDATLQNGGPCCSQNGYCGSSDAYCGAGCQSDFGSCGNSVTTTTASAGSAPTGVLTTDNTCGNAGGGNNQGFICDATLDGGGACCSANGWCGNSDSYCGTGCQSDFGLCGVQPTTTTSASTPGATSDTVCGPQNGNQVCSTGLCCSPEGYCGVGTDYCADPDCQFNFGTCDSDTTPAGTSTINDPRPLLGSVTYTDDIYDCVEANVVALTYDDGPAQYTSQLLDILKQYNFTATFFMTGNNLGKGPIDTTAPYPDVIRRMIAEGHHVASHTWSHYDLSAITSAQRIQQMVKNERAIANIIGKYPTYMRPPYSSCTQASGCWADLQKLGYHRTYFDLDTQDYLNDSPTLIQNSENIVNWALGNATQNDFLSIQHDIHQTSVANLSPYYFDLIKQKGWKGVTVGECLNDPEANWYRLPGSGQSAPVTRSISSSSQIPTSTKTSSSSTKTSSSNKATSSKTSSSKKTTSSKITSSAKKSTSTEKTTSSTKPKSSSSSKTTSSKSLPTTAKTSTGTIDTATSSSISSSSSSSSSPTASSSSASTSTITSTITSTLPSTSASNTQTSISGTTTSAVVFSSNTTASSTTAPTATSTTTSCSSSDPSTTTISGRSCRITKNLDRPGGDIQGLSKQTNSFDNCIAYCASLDQCVSAQYSRTNGFCYVKGVRYSGIVQCVTDTIDCDSSSTAVSSSNVTSTDLATSTMSISIATSTAITLAGSVYQVPTDQASLFASISSVIAQASTTSTNSQGLSTTTSTASKSITSCDVTAAGNFCGKIQTFDSKASCLTSWVDCEGQYLKCYINTHDQGLDTQGCIEMSKRCDTLISYCNGCATKCSETTFRAQKS